MNIDDQEKKEKEGCGNRRPGVAGVAPGVAGSGLSPDEGNCKVGSSGTTAI